MVATADDLLLQGAATRRKARPHGEVADLCRCDDLSALSTNAAAQYRLWQPHVELKNFIPIAVPIIAQGDRVLASTGLAISVGTQP